jgi:predicted Fe-S protein YdhL (DUF1289 family)
MLWKKTNNKEQEEIIKQLKKKRIKKIKTLA